MKWSVENKVLAGFMVALAVVAMAGSLAYQANYRYIEMPNGMIQEHQEALVSPKEIFSLTNQAETRQRTYLISSDKRHLARHAAGRAVRGFVQRKEIAHMFASAAACYVANGCQVPEADGHLNRGSNGPTFACNI